MQNRCPTVRYALVTLTAVLLWTPPPVPLQAQAPDAFTPVTDAMLQSPDADDWLMWRRTLNGWGYSPLDQINGDNVGELRLVWTRALSSGMQLRPEITLPLAMIGPEVCVAGLTL